MERLSPAPPRLLHQRGLSLVFALLALVILALAIAGLANWVSLGSTIVGNYAFQQDAIEASASAAQAAISWLEDNQAHLDVDHSDRGYYASGLYQLDPTGAHTSANQAMDLVDWDGTQTCSYAPSGSFRSCRYTPYPAAAQANALQVNGNTVQWLITRLCQSAGPPGDSNPCAMTLAGAEAVVSEKGELIGGARIQGATAGPFFRIIVRAAGPRNTVGYTETMVHF